MRLIAILLFATASPAVWAGSSNSLLDVSADGKRLLVANTDSGTVTVVNLTDRSVQCELPAGDHPEGTAWAGTVGLITVYGDDRVLFLDADAKAITHILPVDDEPYGIVTTKDGKTAFVSHDYPGSISVIDVSARKVARTFKVGEGCRGLALSNDEKTLYVSEFFTAKLLAVDVATGKVTDRWAGYESDNLARHVVLHPTRPKAYLSHLRSNVTFFSARSSIFPEMSICDLWEKPAAEKRRRTIALDTFNGVRVMANPWESAFSLDGKKFYTIYAGTNDANVCGVIDDDYHEIKPLSIVPLGKNPRAIRVNPTNGEVYVYNALDYEVTVHDGNLRKQAGVKVCTPAHTAEWRRGKELFVTAKPPMGRTGWVSCSSCHPDGLTDARVWQNPEGHRRTPHLFGLAHTHPLHWSADRDEVQDFEYTVRGKLMQGRGLTNLKMKPRESFTEFAELDQHTADATPDLDALALYTNAFPFRLSPHAAGPGKLTPEAERGKALFFSKETNCASCHTGPYLTDSSLKKPFIRHDVGTGDHAAEKIGPMYDTPTLLGVYRQGPYLHDGRAVTLKDVLTTCNPSDKHGRTSQLKPTEVDDVVSFLKSLPYELPPDETPNSVKHRYTPMFPRPTVSDRR
ncbi:c-type cytochrome [Limnoglobus roseus]|uniref:Cytochrome B6 n=1 Tax=Limnoglobus roseus TaxID=2598579 RepID=A0A5C1A589_9BACT|nr:c-type cytochrome [Limnoglobus roseus]QEL13513.1 cytochrome B6 [Limnoglobus roseus]